MVMRETRIRGFSSENVAMMINGVPMNGMENQKVYWSNWAGLSDVTRSMQVQRGLGAAAKCLFRQWAVLSISSLRARKQSEADSYLTVWVTTVTINPFQRIVRFVQRRLGVHIAGW